MTEQVNQTILYFKFLLVPLHAVTWCHIRSVRTDDQEHNLNP